MVFSGFWILGHGSSLVIDSQVQEFDPDVVAGVGFFPCRNVVTLMSCPAMDPGPMDPDFGGHNAYSCDLDILAARFNQPASEN